MTEENEAERRAREGQIKAIADQIQWLAQKHAEKPFVSFYAVGLCEDLQFQTAMSIVHHHFMMGELSRVQVEVWREFGEHHRALAQQQERHFGRRPTTCPKRSAIGGCDYPDCDCAEAIRPS